VLGKDVLEVPGYEGYGYLELKCRTKGGQWGNYLAKVYITPLRATTVSCCDSGRRDVLAIKDVVSALSQDEKSVR
jgi:hypothetical protein